MRSVLSSTLSAVFVTQDVPEYVVQALTCAGLEVEYVKTDQLSERLSDDATPAVIFWDTPADALAGVLRDGEDPERCLEDWLSRHMELLLVLRRHRRRMRLIDARLLSPLSTCSDRERLASWLDLAALPLPEPTDSVPGEIVSHVLSSLVFARLDLMRACLDELEASSLTFESEGLAFAMLGTVSEDFEKIRQVAQNAQDGAAQKEYLQAKLAKAEATISQISSELASAEVSARLRDQEIALLREQLGLQLDEMTRQVEYEAKQEEIRNKTAYESERVLARALTDLRREAQERKVLQARLQETEGQLAALAQERDLLNQNIDEIYASRSWRITKPLRQVRMLVAPIHEPKSDEPSN